MRRKATHNTDEATVDLTPMLDIVFIMLIFFIVTATFVREAGLDVTKPDDDQNQNQSIVQSLRIIITPQDRILINMRDVDRRAVRAVVERYIAQNPKGSVVIQISARARTETVVAAMDQVKLAGVTPSLAPSEE